MQKKKKYKNFLLSSSVSSFHFLTIILIIESLFTLNCDISRSIDKILSYQLTIEQRYNYLYYLVLFDLTFTKQNLSAILIFRNTQI